VLKAAAWVRARQRPGLVLAGLLGWTLVLLAALLVLPALGPRPLGREPAGGLDDFGAMPAFGLTDQLGRPATSDDLRGKVVVADFVYTSCTGACPLLSARMAALQERLRQEGLLGDRVQLLSFTTDPARDTVPVLQAYADQHQADPAAWRFLTGPEHYVVPLIVQGFRLGVQAVPRDSGGVAPDAGSAYDVMHGNRFVLADRRGVIRAYYDGLDLDLERVMTDVRRLLR
jgi:protein SCO1/2